MKLILILFVACYFTDGDMAEKTKAKANEYLIGNLKTWYKLFDVDNDSMVTLDDLEAYKLNIANLSKVGVDRLHIIVSTIDRLWNAVVFNGKSEISEEEFVKKFKTHFETNREKLIATLYHYEKGMVKAFDLNKDNMMSKDEYLLNCKAMEYDTIACEDLIDSYNFVDGKIRLEQIVLSWVQFIIGTHASPNDIVKLAAEHGLSG